MVTASPLLPLHNPLIVCPTCTTAALCMTGGEQRRESTVKILRCPFCGVYHSLLPAAQDLVLYASPVAG